MEKTVLTTLSLTFIGEDLESRFQLCFSVDMEFGN